MTPIHLGTWNYLPIISTTLKAQGLSQNVASTAVPSFAIARGGAAAAD
jgi:hypothetical protein